MQSNTTGGLNTAGGAFALLYNTTGRSNTASGALALESNTTGNSNTASGVGALFYNTTGFANTASGRHALWNNTTGNSNTASGNRALFNNLSGTGNTALGARAGYGLYYGYDNVFVGVGAYGDVYDSGTIRIGGGGFQYRTFIEGIQGVTTGMADAIPVLIDSAGQLGTASSSRRHKEDIHDMAGASESLLALRPVTFRYKKAFADGEKPIQFGLIAGEVAEVFPELVVYNEAGDPETVKYHLLSTLLLNELQKLNSKIAAQVEEIERLRAARAHEIEPLTARLEQLEALLAEAPRLTAIQRKPPLGTSPGPR